jgi:hypothetical protein
VPVYIVHRDDDGPTWIALEPYPFGTLVGKEPRTQFIVDRLESLLDSKQPELFLYEQSAFSTFGVSPDERVWRSSPEYNKEYVRLTLRQRELLNQLARKPRTTFKLIINPVRAYEAKWMRARFDALLEWMMDPEIISNPKIQFVEAPYEGPNRIIVPNSFCIDGFKLHDKAGYEFSMVHTDQHTITDAVATFERVFQKAKTEGATKQSVIKSIQKRRAAYLRNTGSKRSKKTDKRRSG